MNNDIFDINLSTHAKIAYLYLSICEYSPSYQMIAEKCSFSRSTAI